MTKEAHDLEPTNTQRAQWAKAALAVFTAQTYGGDEPGTMHPGDLEDAIADLICDLLHFAHFHPRMDATAIHAHALKMFQHELAEAVSSTTSPPAPDLLETLRQGVKSATEVVSRWEHGNLAESVRALGIWQAEAEATLTEATQQARGQEIIALNGDGEQLLELLNRASFLLRRIHEGDHNALGNALDCADAADVLIAKLIQY